MKKTPLQIRRSYEPNRLEKSYLCQAYEQLMPINKRSTNKKSEKEKKLNINIEFEGNLNERTNSSLCKSIL